MEVGYVNGEEGGGGGEYGVRKGLLTIRVVGF